MKITFKHLISGCLLLMATTATVNAQTGPYAEIYGIFNRNRSNLPAGNSLLVSNASGSVAPDNGSLKIAAGKLVLPFCGGSGTPEAPYLICNAEQLDSVRYFLDKHFKLNNDIDLANYLESGAGFAQWGTEGWNPIGDHSSGDITSHFSGSFKGAGYKITGLWINRNSVNFVGLFGCTDGSRIDSLGVEIAPQGVSGNLCVGGLTGNNYNSSVINNCYTTGNVSGKNNYVGGLSGANDISSAIENCYATGNVSGLDAVGGLTGGNQSNSTITNCYATGNVNGNYNVGGLVGINQTNDATIANSYATGNVSGNRYVGGLSGVNYSTIKDCVAANDSITATSATPYINRIAGNNTNGAYQNNYVNSAMAVKVNDAVETRSDDATTNGTGKPLSDLKTEAFYTKVSNWTGGAWNFASVWFMPMDGCTFPQLQSNPAPIPIPFVPNCPQDFSVTNRNAVTLMELLAIPSEGTFSSDDVEIINNIFDPAGLENGDYIITYTVANAGCMNFYCTFTITVDIASGVEQVTSRALQVYPNPAKDELRIESNGLTITKLEIVDLSGKTIYQFNNARNQINISALLQGIYFINIETDKGIVTRKFVKE